MFQSIKNLCAAFCCLINLQTPGSVTRTRLPGSDFSFSPAPETTHPTQTPVCLYCSTVCSLNAAVNTPVIYVCVCVCGWSRCIINKCSHHWLINYSVSVCRNKTKRPSSQEAEPEPPEVLFSFLLQHDECCLTSLSVSSLEIVVMVTPEWASDWWRCVWPKKQ